MSTIKTIFLFEIIIVFAMIVGIAPQEFSYLILLLLSVSFLRLNILDSLKLFILSIPFFVALPANALSDSMSVWRVLVVILFLKAGWEKMSWLYNSNLAGSKLYLEPQCTNSKLLVQNKIVCKCIKVRNITANQHDSNYRKLFILTALFFIIAALSLFFAQNTGAGVKKILFLANIFLLFPVVIYAIKKENDLVEIMKFILCSSAIVVFIGYVQFLATFFISLYDFWQFWAGNAIKALYGEGLSNLLSYSNTWFSYYKTLPPTLRMFSVMPDSHSFSMLVIISMPAVLALLFYYKQKKQKKYLSIILIFFLLAVYLSGSRGAWMGSVFALAMGVYLFLASSEKEKNNPSFSKIRFILEFIKLLKSKVGFKLNEENNSKHCSKPIAFSVVLFFILMPVFGLILRQNQETQIIKSGINLSAEERSEFSMFERAFSISDFSETSNKGRLQIWRETLISIGNHPFFGVGLGNFNYVLEQSESALKKGSSAHSIYLDIASEIGIFGLIVFLFLLVEIIEYSYRLFYKLKQKHLKIFAGAFFVYFIWICAYGLFDVVIFNDKVLMFTVILIGILYAMGKPNRFSSL